MSDLYSRQISFTYESDSLLRRFPVPRGEISEVEFNLPFVVTGVRIDEKRHQSRNAAIGKIFDEYSLRMVRAGLQPVQEAFDSAVKGLTPEPTEKRAAADRFQARILSDEARNSFHGRLLRYLNEQTEEFLGEDGSFKTAEVRAVIERLIQGVQKEAVVVTFQTQFGISLSDAFQEALNRIVAPPPSPPGGATLSILDRMAVKVNEAHKKYPDYAVDVEVGPDKINNPAASYIKVKAVIKNYRWSKVDTDSKDMRNLRTLVPE
jgi:hypothetical protein